MAQEGNVTNKQSEEVENSLGLAVLILIVLVVIAVAL